MADKAAIFGGHTITLDDRTVTVLTHTLPVHQDIHMVIGDPRQDEGFIRQSMTAETTTDWFGPAGADLSSEMTEDTGIPGDLHMPAHHYLGMTGGAPKLTTPPPLQQMGAMIEDDVLLGNHPSPSNE